MLFQINPGTSQSPAGQPERRQHQQPHQPQGNTTQGGQQDHEQVIPIPQPGDRAPPLYPTTASETQPTPLTPSTPAITFPRTTPVIAVFLRRCGCPFAEKTFRRLADVANQYRGAVTCVAVSQAGTKETEEWIIQVGGAWEVQVVADPRRELFRAWGLGLGSTWYAWNPRALWSAVKLGTDEGIWGRNMAGGNQWQIGGAFAIDTEGVVRWSKPGQHSADEVPDFGEALRALGVERDE